MPVRTMTADPSRTAHAECQAVHDLPDEDKACRGSPLTRIGEEVSEQEVFVPAKVQIVRHICPMYACRKCEGVEDDRHTVKNVPMPPQVIPKGIATPVSWRIS
ncbi:IS66 family transposase zinc-finger binding domain-containing protein [Nitratidesulfovibrio sp. HK-II]